ncbi:hypothetical protein HZR17_00130 [Clostridium botulinum]|uniref:hypothetical protein n=1 Tax=Clostridium botulinum TaxID=1491 RepID=UPI000A869255|nr:hypothetical protein [Clostridium botulinum]MBZ1328167.1 hypothetical protein [Clostridium botulinum]MBZ1331731.1 hypothetical protein [Clostridium botulinum]MBZ1334694.1 hypothetical protein [Clostridium botulinum]MBZ1338364.1 hypothetical protein [Clostridium botulinum]MBZ1342165.1 hypothetical protein [Clostridium botulinum]
MSKFWGALQNVLKLTPEAIDMVVFSALREIYPIKVDNTRISASATIMIACPIEKLPK